MTNNSRLGEYTPKYVIEKVIDRDSGTISEVLNVIDSTALNDMKLLESQILLK